MSHRQAAFVALAVLVWTAPAGAQKPTSASVAALKRWVDAVNTHAPGRPDESARAIALLSYAARRELNDSMDLFLRVLRSERIATRGDPAIQTAAMARSVRNHPGPARFLARAAVLHTDAAIFSDRFPAPPDDAPPPARVRPGVRPDPVPPLLARESLALDQDGQLAGETQANWNWPFARSLLDLLVLPPPSSLGTAQDASFVARWYHAVAAFLYANGLYGEATPHLHRAAELFPDDATLLFDRGCYAEILGLPVHQQLAPDWKVRIPSEEKTNAEAEKLFARAVDLDPSQLEARVRMARLLDLRGRHDEAVSHLAIALAANPPRAVAFYAHLFAARAAQGRGRLDEAAAHYRDASSLFPKAQSAQVGASQVALLAADVPGALAALERLARPADENDPWWYYQAASGRDANELMAAIWQRVRSN